MSDTSIATVTFSGGRPKVAPTVAHTLPFVGATCGRPLSTGTPTNQEVLA
jgi:hypothetical protein